MRVISVIENEEVIRKISLRRIRKKVRKTLELLSKRKLLAVPM